MSDNRRRLRAELFKCAVRGDFPTYRDMLPHLYPRINSGWRSEWSDDLNQIAMEERSHGYPDITLILHRKDYYPSQIDFRNADKPDDDQISYLLTAINEIITLYCPNGTNNIYLTMTP